MTPRTFVLAVTLGYTDDGSVVDYSMQSANQGIPDEIVLTLMQHWLRCEEDKYQSKFNKGT